jgi:predicted metal-binding protein
VASQKAKSDLTDKLVLEQIFQEAGLTDYRWIDPREIVVEEWVRFKCVWGCTSYGHRVNCPPNQPPVAECERFVRGYTTGAVFHFSRLISTDEENEEWTKPLNDALYAVERNAFLAGYYKAFALYPENCSLCKVCAGSKTECRNRMKSRPGPDSLGIDVYATVRKVGYPIQVVPERGHVVNRYGFVLVE